MQKFSQLYTQLYLQYPEMKLDLLYKNRPKKNFIMSFKH